MNRSELVKRCLDVLYGNVQPGSLSEAHTVQNRAERLADLLTELSGQKDQSPLTLRAPTRGEEVAEKFIRPDAIYNNPALLFGINPVQILYIHRREDVAVYVDGMRNNLAAAIDAERADAAKAEREACTEKLRTLRSATDGIGA